jgi:hypothetical protein
VLPPISYPSVLAPCAERINLNARIMQVYTDEILPGAPKNEMSSGVCSRKVVAFYGSGPSSWGASLGRRVAASPASTPHAEGAQGARQRATRPPTPCFSRCTPRTRPPAIAEDGDDGNYGSAATLDVLVLQALSSRIHYGKFVAEAKFRCGPVVVPPAAAGPARGPHVRIAGNPSAVRSNVLSATSPV